MAVMMNDIFMVVLSNQILCALYMQISEWDIFCSCNLFIGLYKLMFLFVSIAYSI